MSGNIGTEEARARSVNKNPEGLVRTTAEDDDQACCSPEARVSEQKHKVYPGNEANKRTPGDIGAQEIPEGKRKKHRAISYMDAQNRQCSQICGKNIRQKQMVLLAPCLESVCCHCIDKLSVELLTMYPVPRRSKGCPFCFTTEKDNTITMLPCGHKLCVSCHNKLAHRGEELHVRAPWFGPSHDCPVCWNDVEMWEDGAGKINPYYLYSNPPHIGTRMGGETEEEY